MISRVKAGRAGRPRCEPRRHDRRRIVVFVIVALALHAAGIELVGRQIQRAADTSRKARPIKVVALSPATLKALRENRPPRTVALEPALPRREPKEPDVLDGQVVDVPPTADDRAPEDARYLSEHNTRVERETRSRHQSQRYGNAMNEPTTSKRGNVTGDVAPQRALALEVGPPRPRPPAPGSAASQSLALELPAARQRDRLALKMDPELGRLRNQDASEEIAGGSDRLKFTLGAPGEKPAPAGSAPEQGPPAIALVPQLGVLAKLSGAPANDVLDDLEEGEGTFLNSREFKYASFFNRMKRGVSENWRPMDEYRRRDPTGNIYGYRTRVTVLSVTLNPDGTLKDAEVYRSSGLDFLDREAVSAFQRAEPFPNPPKGLVNAAGQISFPFGFYVDVPPF